MRISPAPPYSQALNKAESALGRIHGHAFTDALRARIGHSGWSLLDRCATFQHNHSAAQSAGDPQRRAITRAQALTHRILDASTILGYPLQTGL